MKDDWSLKKLIDVSFYIMTCGACLAVALPVINIILVIYFALTNTLPNISLFRDIAILIFVGWAIMLFGMSTNIWIGEDKELNRRIVEAL